MLYFLRKKSDLLMNIDFDKICICAKSDGFRFAYFKVRLYCLKNIEI